MALYQKYAALYGLHIVRNTRLLQPKLHSHVTERYLGSRLFRGGGAHQEIPLRVKKAITNYWGVRRFWLIPHAWHLKIMVFRCLFQSALLSGLLGFVLTESDYEALTSTLVRFGSCRQKDTSLESIYQSPEDFFLTSFSHSEFGTKRNSR